jgi:hypothetical protein
MIELLFVAVALVVVFGLPFVVYLSVKLGTYAYFQGKDLFDREKKNGTKS